MIRNERLINDFTVKGVTREGNTISIPRGNYNIIHDDRNGEGEPFIVIENDAINDITVIFVSEEE